MDSQSSTFPSEKRMEMAVIGQNVDFKVGKNNAAAVLSHVPE
jgi:hypothetical protein